MKKNLFRLLPAICGLSLLLASCGDKDKSIRSAIETKKKEMKELADINATVDKGTVTLSGQYPDSTAKTVGDRSISSIPGVKNVVDNSTVTPAPPPPVTISPDEELSKGVNDAIKDYPGVRATVKDGVVTLTGHIKRASLQKLMMTLHSLKPKKIDNQLTLQ
jgi:osmotically-inducible protein OsmY